MLSRQFALNCRLICAFLDLHLCCLHINTKIINQELYDKVLNAIQLDTRTNGDDGAKFEILVQEPI